MNRIHPDALASIQFNLHWHHGQVSHTDSYYASRVNLWRDQLPADLHGSLLGCRPGEQVFLSRKSEGDFSPFDPDARVCLPLARFNRMFRPEAPLIPRYGRFYPKGVLRDMPGIFKNNMHPFRYGEEDSGRFEADLNHPLAGRSLALTASVEKVYEKIDERGGTSVNWLEAISEGPGMQARLNGRPTDFFAASSEGLRLGCPDERPDTVFYETPRMVNHIDSQARSIITGLYERLIPPEAAVLDLMGSWNSHLPSDQALSRVTGLGLNYEELAANTRLSDFVIHDLNADPALPLADNVYDAVVCTVSVEYLTAPQAVFAEVARVLTPGGIFVVTFSNRWFPAKAIDLWPECHEFERLGLVTEYFLQSGKYDNIETWSLRGYPRPADDKYFPEQPLSDPVYAVWGRTHQGE